MSAGVKLSGKTSQIYWGASPVKIGACRTIQVGQNGAILDADDHDGPDQLVGQIKGDLTVNVWYLDQDTDQMALLAVVGADATSAIEIRPNGTGAGKTKWTAAGRLASWAWAGEVQGVQTIDLKFAVKGSFVAGVQP
jgi:hypothetical protein